jgi:DNA-directed RNA polymerase specialized sigma24 family protein
MPAEGSVTRWIQLLEQGEQEAAQPLWERYFARLAGVANKKLAGRALAVADAEDLALSAFDSLCRGLQRGRFPELKDRDNLWRLLVVITARKVMRAVRREEARKRGGDRAADIAGLTVCDLEQIIGNEPTPEFLAEVSESFDRLLACLPAADLTRIALWKMEGYTNEEIAGKLGRARRTVDRKLRLIRHLWEREAES